MLGLDGRPAIDVLKEDIGEVLARNLERIAGFIHVALPIIGADRPDYVVRNLLAVDLRRGIIAVGDQLRSGTSLMFVKRDPAIALADLCGSLRICARHRRAADPRRPVSQLRRPRAAHVRPGFRGAEDDRTGPGSVPLAGFFTNGEIFRDRLYSYSGVLTLFV